VFLWGGEVDTHFANVALADPRGAAFFAAFVDCLVERVDVAGAITVSSVCFR